MASDVSHEDDTLAKEWNSCSTRRWSRVLVAISVTEGEIDAVTSWDSGVISIGYQQWSMHTPESGPSLLSRIKRIDDATSTYDVLARASGIDTTTSTAPGASPAGDTGTPIADVLENRLLWRLQPSGPVRVELGPDEDRDPISFGLGWRKSGKLYYIGDPAATVTARVAVLARFMPALWQAQAELGLAHPPYALRPAEERDGDRS
ncbi:hypothetical protein [Streptomyces sp. NPDC046939]|uniref:hypothetical protein n=1 Tax=Streptomyces sp. NPDC046939 TaxID=3155376 RepID=UPI0033E7F586